MYMYIYTEHTHIHVYTHIYIHIYIYIYIWEEAGLLALERASSCHLRVHLHTRIGEHKKRSTSIAVDIRSGRGAGPGIQTKCTRQGGSYSHSGLCRSVCQLEVLEAEEAGLLALERASSCHLLLNRLLSC